MTKTRSLLLCLVMILSTLSFLLCVVAVEQSYEISTLTEQLQQNEVDLYTSWQAGYERGYSLAKEYYAHQLQTYKLAKENNLEYEITILP